MTYTITPKALQEFSEIVEKDLKGTLTPEELQRLAIDKDLWRQILLDKKKRTEMQFTSSRTRSFELHKDFKEGRMTHAEWLEQHLREKKWRVNAARFLQQIEMKLREITYV